MPSYTFPTVETIINQATNETFGSTGAQPTALQNDALIRQLDIINREFVNTAHVKHPERGWQWLKKTQVFKTVASTTLSANITAGATTVSVANSNGFDSSGGAGKIYTSKDTPDVFKYTGISTNDLTGATLVDIAHSSGQKCEPLFNLPSDHNKTYKILVDGVTYHHVESDFDPPNGTFSITEGKYIAFPQDIGVNEINHIYECCATDLYTGVENTDLQTAINAPDEFSRYHVNKLKAYIFDVRRMHDKAQLFMNEAEKVVDFALGFDASPTTSEGVYPSW